MSKKWMSSTYFRHNPESVDREERVIRGVSVVTAGEAKGHGVNLDAEFVADVVAMGNAKQKMGLKARFGHPNMCNDALGTYIGRFRNFRLSEDGNQAFADLHISDAADASPQGELGKYVMELAEKESDMFGTSIVFTPGQLYRRREDGSKAYYADDDWDDLGDIDYIECAELHACDAVDEPAANDGLFAADAYGQGELAAKVTEFLDLNPGVMELLKQNQDAVGEFLERYETYRAGNANRKEQSMSQQTANPAQAEAVEETPATVTEQTQQEPVQPEPEVVQEPEALADESDLRAELQRATEDFGAEIAAKAFAAGGGYAEAKDAHYEALKTEAEQLRQQLAAAKSRKGAEPVEYSEGDEKPGGMPWRAAKK